jgi:hypothetical protein
LQLGVCDVRAETFARPLELKGGRVRLVSPNERYAGVEASAEERGAGASALPKT